MSFPHFYPNLKTSQDDWVRRVALSGDEVFVGTASSGIRRHVLGAVEARQVFRVQGTPGVPGGGGCLVILGRGLSGGNSVGKTWQSSKLKEAENKWFVQGGDCGVESGLVYGGLLLW